MRLALSAIHTALLITAPLRFASFMQAQPPLEHPDMQAAYFAKAGTKPGYEVWRIENKEPAPVPAKMYGQFYDGDAYIVLKTTQKPKSSSLEWDIFFWLGEKSEQAEQGIAAYKTVELDESLGGGPTQHRELQGYESEEFMQCFKKVEYLKGGVASGFKHVKRDVYEPRLLHVKGKRSVRVSEVPMSAKSLNSGCARACCARQRHAPFGSASRPPKRPRESRTAASC